MAVSVSDYEVRMVSKSPGWAVRGDGPITATVRAASSEDARQQAVAQHPNYTTTAAPKKLN